MQQLTLTRGIFVDGNQEKFYYEMPAKDPIGTTIIKRG
jgi:hypothetical protein